MGQPLRKLAMRLVREVRWTAFAKKAVIYALSLAIPFSLENAADILDLNPGGTNNSLVSPIFLYQWAVTFGPRKPRAHFVRLVMIDKKTEPDAITSETSPCSQRDFVAQLLLTLAIANPAVIVIDKYYPRDACGPTESAKLVTAMKEVSRKLPLVILTLDKSPVELQSNEANKLRVLRTKGAVVSFPTVDFGPAVNYGLRTLNADERKIPLRWPVLTAREFDASSAAELARGEPQSADTVAVATVRQYDPSTLAQTTIRELNDRQVHPFTSFLKPSQIPTDSAMDLICDHDHARNMDWRNNCKQLNPSSVRLKELRNRVVIIGQNHSQDIHRTVIGSVPGAVLQANYIESLLDDRYLKPSPLWLQILISILWLGVIEWIFTRYEFRPWFALAFSAIATVLLWLVTNDIAVLQLGRYLVLWPPSVVAIIGRFAMLKLHPRVPQPGPAVP